MNIKNGLIYGLNVVAVRLNALSSRIENIIAQSGTSDTEVVSARTNGRTGVTGTTLATRLDEDYYNLNRRINAVTAEVEAARVSSSGEEYNSIDDRLDTEWYQTDARIEAIKEDLLPISARVTALESGGSIPDRVKQAMLAFAQNVPVYNTETGQALYNDLYNALYTRLPISITAAFNQGDTIIYTDDSLDDLKQYLTVTAYYDDSTSGEVTAYTLSGTLEEETSIITVTYNGLTATFTVTVTDWNNIMSRSYPGDLIRVAGGATSSTASGLIGPKVLDWKSGYPRYSFWMDKGVKPAIDTSGNATEYYPIPVPLDATSVTVTINNEASQYVNIIQHAYNPSTGQYVEKNMTGFVASGTTTAIAALADGEERIYIAIAAKYDSAGTTYPTLPNALDIVFE